MRESESNGQKRKRNSKYVLHCCLTTLANPHLQAQVAELEGQRLADARMKRDLLRRIQMLENVIQRERKAKTECACELIASPSSSHVFRPAAEGAVAGHNDSLDDESEEAINERINEQRKSNCSPLSLSYISDSSLFL